MPLPYDAVEGQIAVGLDGSFNWFVNDKWHTQAGTPSGVGNLPQDVVDGQIAIGTDGGFHWYYDGTWYTASFAPSTDINSPQDVVAGQLCVGPDETFHWSPNGHQSFVVLITKQTGIYRTRLSVGTTPGLSTPQVLNIQCRKANPGESGVLRVWLYQGSTLIETYDITLADTFTLDSHFVINYAAITNWSDIEVAVQGISDGGYNLTPQISWIDFDIPT